MLEDLEPQVVLAYGSMLENIFGEYADAALCVAYPDRISRQKNRA